MRLSLPRTGLASCVVLCLYWLLVLRLVPVGVCAGPPQDKATGEDSYTLRGTVINSVTHAAIPHALVFSGDNRFAKLTDDDGHFEFKIPRPSRPQFSANGPGAPQQGMRTVGMVSLNFMARKPGFFGNDSVLWTDARADEMTDVRISLTPEALIIGHVNLAASDGSDKISVSIYRREVQNGHARWVPGGGTSTRANGDFRFANLVEGDYKLFTQELLDNDPLTFDPRGPLHGYPPVYFPSASDFESASVIHVQAGQSFSANLTPTRREYYRVRIGILNMPGSGINVEVEPQAHRGPGYSLGYNGNDSAIEGMLPNGSYTVEASDYGDNGSSGTVNFSVNGAPVLNATLAMAPNSFIQAQVHDERSKAENAPGMSPSNLAGGLQIRLTPEDAFRPNNELWLRQSQNAEEEVLQFGGAAPGTYRLHTGCQPWAYVAAAKSGGRDLLQLPLLVAAGAAVPPVEITVRDDGAELSGKIEDWPSPGKGSSQDSQQLFSNRLSYPNLPMIALLPLPDSTGPFCQFSVNGDGEFTVPQVAPGEYRLIAFERFPQDLEYQDREAMKKYEAKGVEVRLSAGQKERVRLSLVKASE